MRWMKKAKGKEEVTQIPVALITANPAQPRQAFDEGALFALADSIKRYGILQPLSVRKVANTYELIAGERRLRAAVMAGCELVPCIVYTVSEKASAELAVVENLLREDLNMFEVAGAMEQLAKGYGLTQEEIAQRLSVSQSQVANKLRLLRLHDGIREKILAEGLTERHARALLRLPEELWEKTLDKMIEGKCNVAAAEKMVEDILEDRAKNGEPTRKKKRFRGAMRDLRLFYNSVERAMDIVRGCGISVKSRKEEEEKEIRLIISIAK
ncbi:MAG: ParB/RepB/Spo0J family partition protein [Clostridia bacterium]|nr:ParB/RepB/Spo0J family partition protein [Clostridia bacterium]